MGAHPLRTNLHHKERLQHPQHNTTQKQRLHSEDSFGAGDTTVTPQEEGLLHLLIFAPLYLSRKCNTLAHNIWLSPATQKSVTVAG